MGGFGLNSEIVTIGLLQGCLCGPADPCTSATAAAEQAEVRAERTHAAETCEPRTPAPLKKTKKKQPDW